MLRDVLAHTAGGSSSSSTTPPIDEDDLARWQSEFDGLDRGEVNVTLFVPSFTAAARRPV